MGTIDAHCTTSPLSILSFTFTMATISWILGFFFHVLWFSCSDLHTLNFIIWKTSYSLYILCNLFYFPSTLCCGALPRLIHINIPYSIVSIFRTVFLHHYRQRCNEQSCAFSLFTHVRLQAVDLDVELPGCRVMSIFHFTRKVKLSSNKVVVSMFTPTIIVSRSPLPYLQYTLPDVHIFN